jgi:hypothetical protein
MARAQNKNKRWYDDAIPVVLGFLFGMTPPIIYIHILGKSFQSLDTSTRFAVLGAGFMIGVYLGNKIVGVLKKKRKAI